MQLYKFNRVQLTKSSCSSSRETLRLSSLSSDNRKVSLSESSESSEKGFSIINGSTCRTCGHNVIDDGGWDFIFTIFDCIFMRSFTCFWLITLNWAVNGLDHWRTDSLPIGITRINSRVLHFSATARVIVTVSVLFQSTNRKLLCGKKLPGQHLSLKKF